MISLIIINYNTKELVYDCVQSFLPFLNSYGVYEILIIDNDSIDGSFQYLKRLLKGNSSIRIIRSKINLGFGKANNLGAKLAKGDFLVFANSDTKANNIDFNIVINNIEKLNNVGQYSVKILNNDKSIQSLGFEFPGLISDFLTNFLFWNFNFVKKIRFSRYINKGIFVKDWISGSFFVIQKEIFCKIGGFDEKIFMYSEDLDLSFRLHKNQRINYVDDTFSIFHFHGKSSKLSFKRLYKAKLNYYYVLKKNRISLFPELLFLFSVVHIIVLLFLKIIVKLIKELLS